MLEAKDSPGGNEPGQGELRLAVEAAPVGLFMVDSRGRIALANAEMERIFGYTHSELIGESVDLLVPSAVRGAHQYLRGNFSAHASRRLMGEGEELYGKRKDGSLVPVEIGLTPSESPAGTFVIGAVTDLTERRKHRAEHVLMEDELRRSQRLSALGEVIGAVAHDFNNILTTIIAPLDLCMDHCDDLVGSDHPIRQELEVAWSSAERAVTLTRQLLAFSRRRVFCPVPLDLNEVVQRSRPMLDRLTRAQVGLSFVFGKDLPSVVIDPSLFDQVLMNLTLNGGDAIEGGGEVVVRTGVASNGWVFIEVTDTGTGMDEETQARIFEPFFTTKKQGTGLGLSTVHGIVTQAGGIIEVESKVGRGTTFRVQFEPSHEDAVALSEMDRPATAAVRLAGKGEKILIVDDAEALRKVVARALGRSGYVPIEAGWGERALSLLRSEGNDFGLVITDIGLPDMDGIDLATRIERMVPGMPILFISGHSEEDVIKRFSLVSHPAFLEKPFTVSTLMSQVHRMVR